MTATRFKDHLLDAAVHGSRPAASAVPQGTLFPCTTHGKVYQSDGVSTWTDWHDPATGTPGAHSHAGADITSGTVADARIDSAIARDTEVAAAVTGLLDFKGSTDASGNPNYPAASKGDAYVISVAGKVGGASGMAVDVGDVYVASADNAGGTQAGVGASWFILEHNLAGALLAANNLSELASAATARGNLGLGTSDSPQFTGVNVGHATDTTVTRDAAGDIAVEGNRVYRAGGTDVPVTDGGTGASTATLGFDALSPMTTAGDLIVGGTAGTRTRLAKGSDGQVLTVDPTTHLLVWATPSGGGSAGALVLLEQHTASASATLDFTTCISATYDDYLIEFVSMIPATNTDVPWLRMGTGGGPTYDSGANYSWGLVSCAMATGTSGGAGAGGATKIQLFNAGTSSSYAHSWSLRLFNPGSATARKLLSGTGVVVYSTGPATYLVTIGGSYDSATAVTAFQFLFSTGNIASGTIRVYGIAKS